MNNLLCTRNFNYSTPRGINETESGTEMGTYDKKTAAAFIIRISLKLIETYPLHETLIFPYFHPRRDITETESDINGYKRYIIE